MFSIVVFLWFLGLLDWFWLVWQFALFGVVGLAVFWFWFLSFGFILIWLFRLVFAGYLFGLSVYVPFCV